MMRTMRFHHGTPTMTAASSISPESCSIALMPLREANGRYLTEPTSTSTMNALPSPNVNAMVRNAAPKAIEGMR